MYVVSVLTMGIVCALADTLMPEGTVKRVGKLACGMAMLCIVLRPVAAIDLSAGEGAAQTLFSDIKQGELQLEQQMNWQMKGIIEEECAAYIVDKAAQLGMSCRAQVICKTEENGLPIPWEAQITGVLSGDERSALSEIVAVELGIPADRQEFYGEEAVA